MKKIKILIFIILFSCFYTTLASNVPLGYWGNNLYKNNQIKNNYNIPLGYMGNNFNKKRTNIGIINQTPIGYFDNYKGKEVVFIKLNINSSTGAINSSTGVNIIKTEISTQAKNDILKKRIELAKISGEIYTYRLREYIKNDDGSFTNIDTLKPYTGNIDNLKKKTIEKDLIVKQETINNIPIKDIVNLNNNNLSNNVNIDLQEKIRQEIIRNNEIQAEKKRISEQNKQNELNNLKSRIDLAKSNGRIYTYRLREYIKNNDGSFTNIDTYRPYGGKTSNLKIKTEEKEKNNVRANLVSAQDTENIKKTGKKTKSTKINTTQKPLSQSTINSVNNTNNKGEFILKSKNLFNDMIYIYSVKQKLLDIKSNNLNNYIVLNSCFIETGCSDINYFNKIKVDIEKSINLDYLAKRLSINIEDTKVLDYKDMLKIIFTVFGKDNYFNLNISEKEYSNNINTILLNTIKDNKISFDKVKYLSYKRIYFSILESPDFSIKLNKLLFNK